MALSHMVCLELKRSSPNHLWFLQAGAVEAGMQALFFLSLHDGILNLLGSLSGVWETLQQGETPALSPELIDLRNIQGMCFT